MLNKKIFASLHFPLVIFSLSIALLTVSCSKTPDVRLTMCQDLTALFLNSPENIEWQQHEPIMRGYKDLEMQVSYSDGQTVNKASCFYKYIQNEDAMGAEEFNTPTVAYSTYPNKMILNGKVMDKKQLADGVNTVMLSQGRKTIAKVKKAAAEGLEKINHEVEKQLEK